MNSPVIFPSSIATFANVAVEYIAPLRSNIRTSAALNHNSGSDCHSVAQFLALLAVSPDLTNWTIINRQYVTAHLVGVQCSEIDDLFAFVRSKSPSCPGIALALLDVDVTPARPRKVMRKVGRLNRQQNERLD